AAGYNNTIIHTTDGGRSWTLQSIENDTAKIYYDIYFADGCTGWLVSNFGEILQTGNGGASWNIQTRSESTGGAKCLSFIDEEVGFAVLPGLTFLKTTNGGARWTSAPLQLTCPGRQYNPFEPTDLFFTDEQHGWIATLTFSEVAIDSTAIFYTTDGGDTWICQNSLFIQYFKSIHFVDNLTGWTIGKQWAELPSTDTIFHTTDGGCTWSLQSEEEGLFFQDIYFTDAEHGWALDYRGGILKYVVP
ncbi:MAG: YCF48-related protein, partial [Candidatus Neomarinimicrobiota bacterium]